MAWLLLIFAGTILMDLAAARWLIGRLVRQELETELDRAAGSLEQLVRTGLDASIRSYLRGLAEEGEAIAAGCYWRQERGELSPGAARRLAAETLLARRIGTSGYFYVLDGKGRVLVHPEASLRGRDLSREPFVREQLARRSGYLEYQWPQLGGGAARPKAAYSAYFAPWDWIITASSYRQDFGQLVKVSDFRASVLATRIGENGYSFLLDTKGNLLVHPFQEGRNVLDLRDADGQPFIREILAQGSGRLDYRLQEPGMSAARTKSARFHAIPGTDWIAVSTGYEDEFARGARQLAAISAGTLLLSALLAALAALLISRVLTRPLINLAARVSRAGPDTFEPMPVEGRDEVGFLAATLNAFMERVRLGQDRLGVSEGRYRRLFESAVEGIFQATPEGRFLSVNPSLARMLGYDSPEALLEAVGDLPRHLAGGDAAWEELVDRLGKDGFLSGAVLELVPREGGRLWGSAHVRAQRDGHCIERIEGFVVDVTEEVCQREVVLAYQQELEARVNRRTHELEEGIRQLEAHNRAIGDLNAFSEALQLCQASPESLAVIESYLPKLFPSGRASLAVPDPATTLLEPVGGGGEPGFAPSDCWGVRGGRPHLFRTADGGLRCAHLQELPLQESLCLPLLAGGELHGLLTVFPEEGRLEEARVHGQNVAEQVALALATLKLRERLRDQAIRDPLTGLYNRRYMDEAIPRDLHQARRSGHPVGFAILDLDHFKRVNDEHGHQAGDAVLRQLAHYISARLRADDLLFRLGGEEFLVTLGDANRSDTATRLEVLRGDIASRFRVEFGERLFSITVSVGVAAFPDDGESLTELLKAADTALYRAKSEGRNRVCEAA